MIVIRHAANNARPKSSDAAHQRRLKRIKTFNERTFGWEIRQGVDMQTEVAHLDASPELIWARFNMSFLIGLMPSILLSKDHYSTDKRSIGTPSLARYHYHGYNCRQSRS